jgi:hypothetical protein
LFCYLFGVQQWWKIWSKEVHIKHWVLSKEGGNVELKITVTHNLGDGVSSIVEWKELLMGSCKTLFLQVQPNFISHLKLVWHPVLIMALLVLGNGLLQNILNLLEDVLDLFNELGGFVELWFEHGIIFLGWTQGVVQHPWNPMVEIPTPPESGCGRLSYVWICCNYTEYREESHPMCVDYWNFTYTRYAGSSC